MEAIHGLYYTRKTLLALKVLYKDIFGKAPLLDWLIVDVIEACSWEDWGVVDDGPDYNPEDPQPLVEDVDSESEGDYDSDLELEDRDSEYIYLRLAYVEVEGPWNDMAEEERLIYASTRALDNDTDKEVEWEDDDEEDEEEESASEGEAEDIEMEEEDIVGDL
jgi:hypothetical protein